MMEQGLLHLYWGDGQGEDHRRMGLALRALGSGKRVVIVQFLKGGQSGEIPLLASWGKISGQGRAEVRVPDERSGKGRCPGRAERKPDRRTGRACRPAYSR